MKPALLLIDVQKGFDDPIWGRRNNQEAEAKIGHLLTAWREAAAPVLHVRHDSRYPELPLHPANPGNAFKPVAEPLPGEPVFAKQVNSAFIGTGLESYLHQVGIERLVIVGLTTDHCVSTTARMGGNLGFDVVVVSDATATFDRQGPNGDTYSAEEVHRINLASLHGEFARVMDTAEALKLLG